jgi:ABC-type dipeptide/oligopeptide/nickel transport system permease component
VDDRKGLPNQLIILRHALRNALLPTISVLALNIGYNASP